MTASAGAAPLQGLLQEDAEELYEEAPCGYVSFLIEGGGILRANATLARWVGCDAAALAGGERFETLLTVPARILHATRHLMQLRTSGAADAVALELRRADGSALPVLVNSRVKRDAAGRPLVVRSMVFDATVYRRYEQSLVEARQRAEAAEGEARQALATMRAADLAKSRFLAAMNHEFRSPVGIILGYSELLLEAAAAGRGDAAWAGYLQDMDAAARHLLELVEEATRYAGLEALERDLQRQPASLRAVAQAGLQQAGAALEQAGLRVVTAFEDAALLVNPAAVSLALSCLLRQAIAWVPPGATLLLSSHCRGDPSGPAPVALELRCEGLLLSPAALDQLRRPLEAPEVYGRGLEGAGLGLALADRIAKLHGGRLWAEQTPESGAVLSIELLSQP